MAQILTDFDKLKTNYAFLQEHSTLYDKFDGDVESDPKDSTYDLLCSQHISSLNENVIKHKNFCKKLMRNLGHFSHNPELHSFTSESCNILNYWVYNSKKKHDIPEKIINKVFGEYSGMLKYSNTIRGCSYHSYDTIYEDPMIAIVLNIFNTYIGDVRDALMNRDASTHMPALKFVCDCVKIYKNEKFKYCSNNNPKDPKHQKNCEEFNAFKFAYTSYLFGQSDLVKKIPSLDNIDKEYSSICGQFEETTVNVKLPTLNVPVVSSSDGDSVDTEHETSSPKPINVETRNNPISSTVSTSLGAVAGASSVLALLYKFTPGGNWIRSGIGGNRRRINSNLYEDGPNELLFDGFEGRDMSSYNTRYNVGYGSV
ncbi:Plasmodium vivax Vir protein, putative [Plasmodium vivax]|uniref:Vir protein, putative n=1 Tax=Plasmodium vivax TaxID=5855 RepID=A0A1G4EEY7_PLAVI|nr:Plasmodium vivax Vir protein, putative [Plasmodium vivax]